MDQINQPYPGKRSAAAIALIAIFCGAIVLAPALAWPATLASTGGSRRIKSLLRPRTDQLAAEPVAAVVVAQNDNDEEEVPPGQVDKYIGVYEAMQKDHSLTVDQAASKEGLTVAQFRDLERRIERDDTLRERVRKALRQAVNPKEKDSSDE